MIEALPLSAVYAFLSAIFLDWKTGTVMYAVKSYRVLVLWMIVFAMEKVFSENYMRRMFVEGSVTGRPPPFTQLVSVCWALEFIALFIPILILVMMYVRYKSTGNSFIIDDATLKGILVDYVLSSLLYVMVGNVIVKQIQDRTLFRYEHDGLRGIRAGAQLFFQSSALILFIPFYSLAE